MKLDKLLFFSGAGIAASGYIPEYLDKIHALNRDIARINKYGNKVQLLLRSKAVTDDDSLFEIELSEELKEILKISTDISSITSGILSDLIDNEEKDKNLRGSE